MKIATIEINGRYRAVLAYDEIIVTNDAFTRDGQRIELYIDNHPVAVVYGRISLADPDENVSDINDTDEVIIEIAE